MLSQMSKKFSTFPNYMNKVQLEIESSVIFDLTCQRNLAVFAKTEKKNQNNPHLRLCFCPPKNSFSFRKEGKLQKKDRSGVVLPPHNRHGDSGFRYIACWGVFFLKYNEVQKPIYQRTSSWILTSQKKQNFKTSSEKKKKTRSSHYSTIKRRCFSPSRLRPSYLRTSKRPMVIESLTAQGYIGVLYNPELSQIFKRIDVCMYEAYIYILCMYIIYLPCNFHIWYIYKSISQRDFLRQVSNNSKRLLLMCVFLE